MAKISKKTAAAQTKAQAMAAAFRKIGMVGRATNAELREAMYVLSDMGDHEGVNAIISEETRRAAALKSLRAAIGL